MSKKNSNVLNNKKLKFLKESNKIFKVYSLFKKNLQINKNKKILVAVSGGPDSLALVVLTKLYEKEYKIKAYFALVDHGIRKESAKEANLVKNLLSKNKIILNILKNKKKFDSNIQSNARKIRYSLLENFCKKKKINIILTAHHSEDQVETFLIRLSRGSGVQGLSSMKIETKLNNNLKLIRPLLDHKKKDLIYISKKIFGKFVVDPTNKDIKYLRTKVRKLKTVMENSGIHHDQIIKSIKNLGLTRDTLNFYTDKIYQNTVVKKKNKLILNYSLIYKESIEIKLKIISKAIKSFSKSYYPPRSEKILRLIKAIESNKQKRLTLGGCLVEKIGNFIEIQKEA